MSRITIAPDASGTAVFTVASPATDTSRVVTLPDATTTLVGTDATQTLTNKTLTAPVITGGSLSGTSGVLTLGTAQASTSGTAIDFTGIPSWAKRVTVILSGVSGTGTDVMTLQLGTSAGIDATGYSGSTGLAGGTVRVNYSTGILTAVTSSAVTAYHGTIVLTNITGNTWVASLSLGTNGDNTAYAGGGTKALSGVLDRVRLSMAANTFDAGTINIMYEG